MVIQQTTAFILGATVQPILIFDMYFKCTGTLPTNFVAIIYTVQSKSPSNS